ncbi:MAG: ABC transporter substrate-binding protein [Hyphomonadaceae bacterium]|nr:ABC transporter substrate-binding protein [Hyphomonadaceae bacterium]
MQFHMSRAGFLAAALAAGALAFSGPAEARRVPAAEAYVQTNATQALRALSNTAQNQAQRRQEFSRLMSQFADVPYISVYVLSLEYGRRLNADPALRTEWINVFRDFAMARYETEFDRYRGNAVTVITSNETVAGRRAEVLTEFAPPPGQSQPLRVRWRLNTANGQYKVINVAIVSEGGDLWLADFQRDVFRAELERNGGDLRALIRSVQGMTASMRAAPRRG